MDTNNYLLVIYSRDMSHLLMQRKVKFDTVHEALSYAYSLTLCPDCCVILLYWFNPSLGNYQRVCKFY